ncbi:type I polyketide synthase [Nocardiopsis sp. CNR-923]|uniref:type I polyketide synthase n=1 Tax=Nocardiopsis sp. CNR-923 TaxID=1904965 RepID=UPI0021CC8F75|nr:type I polyketide synthase [Nocardiopsis sp. CNR-923]
MGVGPAAPAHRRVPWTPRGGVRRAGVSSFGISGTNAHVVLEQPPGPGRPTGDGRTVAWTLSARGEPALRAQAARLRDHVAADAGLTPEAVGHALATTRTAFEHRAAVVGSDRATLLEGLAALAEGRPSTDTVEGRALPDGPVVFVFPGQGSQWPGMAADLLDGSPVFRAAMDECSRALARYTDWSLTDVVRQTPGAPGLDRVDVVQPVLWAVMVSLARVWRSAGVEPAAVVGHSQGEIAAACVAGALSLDDGARVVALRSQAIAEIKGVGGMASVPLPAARARERMSRFGDRVHVAALNGPESTIVAGDAAALAALVDGCRADGVRARLVDVDYASHTPYMEELHDRLMERLGELSPRSSGVPMYSTVTECPIDTSGLDTDYWYCNLRNTVRFDPAVRRLLKDGHQVFVEVSPHPVLTGALLDIIADAGAPGHAVGTLRRDEGGTQRLMAALAAAHVSGARVDWPRLLGGSGLPPVDLPTYAFQRERHWLAAPAPRSAPETAPAEHPLLTASLDLAESGQTVYTGRLSPDRDPWLADHVVRGDTLLPGAAVVELALHAGDRVGLPVLEDLTLERPVPLDGDRAVEVQLTVAPGDASGRRALGLHVRAADGGPWTRCASGLLAPWTAPVGDAMPAEWPPPGAEPVEPDYPALAERGYGYGPRFRGLRAVWRDGEEWYAEVRAPEGIDVSGYGLHPALLDAALHPLLTPDGADPVELPFSWSGVRLHAVDADGLRVRIRSVEGGSEITLTDPTGAPVAEAAAVALRPMTAGRRELAVPDAEGSLLHVAWETVPEPDSAPDLRYAVVGPVDPWVPGADHHLDLDSLLAALAEGAPAPDTIVVDLRAAGSDPVSLETTDAGGTVVTLAASTSRPASTNGTSAPSTVDAAPREHRPVTEATRPGSAGATSDAGGVGVADLGQVSGSVHRGTADPGGTDGAGGTGVVAEAHRRTADAAALLATWSTDDRLADTVLTALTSGAVATGPDEPVRDLAGTPLWGLLRTARTEHPGRVRVVDLDAGTEAPPTAALATDEPEAALRDGRLRVPRLAAYPGRGALRPPAEGDWHLTDDAAGRSTACPSPSTDPAHSATARCASPSAPPGSTSATSSSPSTCTPAAPDGHRGGRHRRRGRPRCGRPEPR